MGFNEQTIRPEQLYQDFLESRNFDQDDINALGLQYLSEQDTQTLLGFPEFSASVKIPYFDMDGNETDFVRVRVLNPRGKRKYSQRQHSGSHIYFSKNSMWASARTNLGLPLIVTEGEFKAHAITKAIQKEGLPHICLALAGVSSWTDKSKLPIHKDLMAILYSKGLASRDVYILFDYDGKYEDGEPNDQVALEETKLAITLAGLGAKVHLCRIGKFKSIKGQKYAIDDHLEIGGTLSEVLNDCIDPTMVKNSEEYYLYTARTQWGIFNGQWVRLSDGMQMSSQRIRTELANQSWLRPGPNGRMTIVKLADAYPAWSKRLNLKGLGMFPQHQGFNITPDGYYNFTKNWKYEPLAGPCDPWLHWCKYFFKDAPEFEEFFHNWVAQFLQKPWERNNTTIQFISPRQGIGKSFTVGWIAEMMGELSLSLGPDRLFERFNSFLLNRILIIVDEPSTDNARHADTVKNYVTNDSIPIEIKNQDVFSITNYINYAFTTNHAKVTTVNEGARREAIYIPHSLDPIACHAMIHDVKTWCKEEQGFEHMMHFYTTRDLSTFDSRAPAPMTDHKQEVIQASKSAWAQFAQDVWEWVDLELDGVAALSKSMMTTLIRYFDYESARLTSHNINNSFNELCFVQQNKVIKNHDGQPVRCLLLGRTARDLNVNYKDVLDKTNLAIEKLIQRTNF